MKAALLAGRRAGPAYTGFYTFSAEDIALSDGATVTFWDEQIQGADFNAGSAVFDTPSIGGRPAVDFNGSSHYLRRNTGWTTSGHGVGTLVVVVDHDMTTGTGVVFGFDDTTTTSHYVYILLTAISGTMRVSGQFRSGVTPNVVYGNTAIPTGTPTIIEFSGNDTFYQLRVNNAVQTLTVQAGSNNGAWLWDGISPEGVTMARRNNGGGDVYYNGRIAYATYKDAVLSTDERTALYGYLSSHYGITI